MARAETTPQRDVPAGWSIRRVIDPIVRWLGRALRALRALRRHRRTHSGPVTAGPTGGRGAEGFLRSVDHSDRTRYRRPPPTYLRLQWLGHLLTSWAIVPKNVVNLDVPGRRSGVIRRTTLLRVEHAGEYFLVALAGESEWVRNVRAAAGRVVVGRKTRHAATLIEVPLQERAPVIRAYLLRAGRQAGSKAVANEARYYFGVSADPSPEEIRAVVEHYPVFRIVEDRRAGGAD